VSVPRRLSRNKRTTGHTNSATNINTTTTASMICAWLASV